MSNTDTYMTISGAASGLFKDKGSKFIAFLYPITSDQEVKPIIDSIKSEYYDARHHCYAYRIGLKGDRWRTVDDGEPSGTAAKPMLGTLISNSITDTLAVVVRYFGGTKLGVPGLINAYRKATLDAIQNANIIEKTVDHTITLQFDYSQTTAIMKLIKIYNPKIIEQSFDNYSKIKLAIRAALLDDFCAKALKIESLTILY